jgi:hypothetical protein
VVNDQEEGVGVSRPFQVEYAGALYHITSRGKERKKIFLDDVDRKRFLGILEECYWIVMKDYLKH